jgi:hypothetical protein
MAYEDKIENLSEAELENAVRLFEILRNINRCKVPTSLLAYFISL